LKITVSVDYDFPVNRLYNGKVVNHGAGVSPPSNK